jgi:hypothetical protein
MTKGNDMTKTKTELMIICLRHRVETVTVNSRGWRDRREMLARLHEIASLAEDYCDIARQTGEDIDRSEFLRACGLSPGRVSV